MLRFQRPGYFYNVRLDINLFGEYYVHCEWGSTFTKLGNDMIKTFDSCENANAYIEKIKIERHKRGYVPTLPTHTKSPALTRRAGYAKNEGVV